jgi:hypothetical protein
MGGQWSNCCCAPPLESKFIYVARPWGVFWREFDVAATETANAGGYYGVVLVTGHSEVRYVTYRETIVGTFVKFGVVTNVDSLVQIVIDQDHGRGNTTYGIDGDSTTAAAYVAGLAAFNSQDGPAGGFENETVVQSVTPTTYTREHSGTSNDGFGGFVDYGYVITYELLDAVTIDMQVAKCEADMGDACERRIISGSTSAIVVPGGTETIVGIDYCHPSQWSSPLPGADSFSSGILLRPRVNDWAVGIYAEQYSSPWDGVFEIAGAGLLYPSYFTSLSSPVPAWFRGIPANSSISTLASTFDFKTDALKLDGSSYRLRYGDGADDEGIGDVGALKSCWSLPLGFGCGITSNGDEKFEALDTATGWLEAPVCMGLVLSPGIYVFESAGVNGWANRGGYTFGTEPTCCP